MRQLTVRRTKSFVGSMATMKVYIEDPTSDETVIRDIPCRKIGQLKNGESGTFQISEEAAKIFVIAGKTSKNYCFDCYELPEGKDDVLLTGKNTFNPATGNAFLFDNNPSSASASMRKKGKQFGILVLCISIIVGAVVGFFIGEACFGGESVSEMTFSKSGIEITLTDEFIEQEYFGYTAVYTSRDVGVLLLKEEFSLSEELSDATLYEYAESVMKNNLINADIRTENGQTYFEYERSTGDATIRFRIYLYKSEDAFWLVQFGTSADRADSMKKDIRKWAESVRFR